MAISMVTRRNILDEMTLERFNWAGRLEEPDFLARLYDLDDLPSYDRRFKTAYGDIYQHRVNNEDWEADWVFTDTRFDLSKDSAFLAFLAETVHPVVRSDSAEAAQIVSKFNRHLRRDGWELAEVGHVSGYTIYAARETLAIPAALQLLESSVAVEDRIELGRQITRMGAAVESDPDLAIGTAKELIETCCFTILDALEVQYDRKWSIGKLLKETAARLSLAPDSVHEEAKAASSIKQILGSLGQIVQGVTEVRNEFGTGHGRSLRASGLSPRHARLVVGAASTLATFLFETYQLHYGDDGE